MSRIAIRVESLSKRYQLGRRQGYRTLRDTLADAFQKPFRRSRAEDAAADEAATLWALRDVGFEVRSGEVMGVVGGNGAGKSTLLKVLSRITEPSEGTVEIRGRVGSLLEVGTGFHPELTGRENIFLNGAILGMKKAEIERQFDAIVSFAEVERFVDTPVKHYSSGMYMRLAFAVAAHLNPEILLIDEVLAVGDTAFQKKCLSRMNDVAKEGRTIVFVSHNLIAVESLCSRAILLNRGRIRAVGSTHSIVSEYLSQAESANNRDLSDKPRRGTGEIRFSSVAIRRPGGDSSIIRAGDDIEITLEYTSTVRVLRPTFCISIHSVMAVPIFCVSTRDLNFEIGQIDRQGTLRLVINRANLMPGRYLVHIAAGDTVHVGRYDHIVDAAEFEIQPADVYGSGRLDSAAWTTVFFDCRWQMSEGERNGENDPVTSGLVAGA